MSISEKDIGVEFNSNRDFVIYIHNNVDKASPLIGVFLQSFKHIDTKLFITLLYQMIIKKL